MGRGKGRGTRRGMVGHPVDMFSILVLLYRIVYWSPPFLGETYIQAQGYRNSEG